MQGSFLWLVNSLELAISDFRCKFLSEAIKNHQTVKNQKVDYSEEHKFLYRKKIGHNRLCRDIT